MQCASVSTSNIDLHVYGFWQSAAHMKITQNAKIPAADAKIHEFRDSVKCQFLILVTW